LIIWCGIKMKFKWLFKLSTSSYYVSLRRMIKQN